MCALDKMIRNCESSVNILTNMESYVEFHPSMLPEGTSRNKLLSFFDFLSPIMVILHGSTVSKKKFSTKKQSDLDIVCVSLKAAFWPLEQLYEKMNETLQKEGVRIDVSIITYNGLLSIIEGRSSLSTSFGHGFSIMYPEGKR